MSYRRSRIFLPQLTTGVPWPFLVLLLVTLVFMVLGVRTDKYAVSQLHEIGAGQVLDKSSAEYITYERLCKSADFLYDLGKVSLGALISSITLIIKDSYTKAAKEEGDSADGSSTESSK